MVYYVDVEQMYSLSPLLWWLTQRFGDGIFFSLSSNCFFCDRMYVMHKYCSFIGITVTLMMHICNELTFGLSLFRKNDDMKRHIVSGLRTTYTLYSNWMWNDEFHIYSNHLDADHHYEHHHHNHEAALVLQHDFQECGKIRIFIPSVNYSYHLQCERRCDKYYISAFLGASAQRSMISMSVFLHFPSRYYM